MNRSRSILAVLSALAGLAASSCSSSPSNNGRFPVKKGEQRGWGEMYGGNKKVKEEDLPPIPVPASGPEKPLEAPQPPRGPDVPYEASPYDDPDYRGNDAQ